MNEFEHERLDVYQAAIQFLVLADTVAGELPRGRGYLADQLRRAASSIAFNIAEGAGELAPADKARFYRMARRSATESAAILDGCRSLSDDRRISDRSRSSAANRGHAHRGGREDFGLGLGLGLGLSQGQPIKTTAARY